MVKSLQETWVRSLGQEDPLKKEMATHSSILCQKVPWTGAWWATAHGVTKELDTTKQQQLPLKCGSLQGNRLMISSISFGGDGCECISPGL